MNNAQIQEFFLLLTLLSNGTIQKKLILFFDILKIFDQHKSKAGNQFPNF
jgi:hypothetical protein